MNDELRFGKEMHSQNKERGRTKPVNLQRSINFAINTIKSKVELMQKVFSLQYSQKEQFLLNILKYMTRKDLFLVRFDVASFIGNIF